MAQQLADFFGGGSAARDVVEGVARQQTEELVDDVAQQLADFFSGEPAPGKPSAPRAQPLDLDSEPAKPQPAPPREPPEDRDPKEDAADDTQGTPATMGPFAFTIPAGWGISKRYPDGSGLHLGPAGVESWPRYITFLLHPFEGTPEGVNREILWLTHRQGTTAAVKVGREKYSGLWFSGSDGGGYVLFSSGGSVYMLGYGSSADTETLREVLRSIEPQGTRSARVERPPRPQSSPRREPSVSAPTRGGVRRKPELPADTDEVVQDVSQQLAEFFGGPAGTARFVPPHPLPKPDRHVEEYLGLRWHGRKGEECVWAARQFAEKYLGHTIPRLGADGGAEELFRIEAPGFRKVANDGRSLPQPGDLIVWDRSVGKGYGHVAVTLDKVDPRTRTVRVIDSNWGNDRRGQIHDVRIGGSVQGWLVAE